MKRAGESAPPVDAIQPEISGMERMRGACQNQAPCSSGRASTRQ